MLIKAQDRLFLNTISHEIRTPLCILKMGIENLEASCAGRYEKDELEILEILKRNVDKLEKLISDLFDSSRFESDTIDVLIK